MAAQFDLLQHAVNDVLVSTAKVFRASSRDDKTFQADATAAMEIRVLAAIDKFNGVLDDVEADIAEGRIEIDSAKLRAKAVLQRDLNQLRASRKPPAPVVKLEAPLTQMAINIEPSDPAANETFTGLPGPPTGKQPNKPVAPFPNMGFEGASPAMAPTPSPKTIPKAKEPVKLIGKPAVVAAAAAGRPASAPPRKESKGALPQAARPGGAATAPQTPLGPPTQAKSVSALPSNTPTATATPNSIQNPPAAAVPAPPPAAQNFFTDMTFTLAPPPAVVQAQKQGVQTAQPRRLSQQQQPQPSAAAPNPGVGGPAAPITQQPAAGPANVANMGQGPQGGKPGGNNNMADDDAKIEGLFDLGSLDLDYDLGNGDSSNFNDMFFGNSDGNGGSGEFDDAYFNLNG
ncbi:hypothetical protein N0V88_005776 [Collariella sp. IMI 366227]|nr:hypothetical protein N0V88_005776 [Collariella sp. IMI 366227]